MKEKIKKYMIKNGNNADRIEAIVEANFELAIKSYPNAPAAYLADFILCVCV